MLGQWWARGFSDQINNQDGPGRVFVFQYRVGQPGVVGQLRHDFSARAVSRANNPGVFVGLTNKAWDGSQLKWGSKGEEDKHIRVNVT